MRFGISDHDPRFARKAAAVLHSWAHSPVSQASQSALADISERVTALIVGTAEDRMGPKLCEDGIVSLRKTVDDCVRNRQPISLYVMWGGLKHYVDLGSQDVDAAELFALIQFSRLDRCVRRIYAPGIAVCIYLEDFGVNYEDGVGQAPDVEAKVATAVNRYCGRFEQLASAIAGRFTVCRRFADICPQWQWRQLRARADDNIAVLNRAWIAAKANESAASDLLRTIGWDGGLPAEMRAHYRDRLESLYPDADPNSRVDRLLRYFAMVALYQQIGCYRPQSPSIKFSMYLPAPGIPKQRLRERLHMRTLSQRHCSQTMPPWTSWGCFVRGEDGVPAMKLRSRRLLSEQSIELRPIQIEIEGRDGKCAVLSHVLVDRMQKEKATYQPIFAFPFSAR